MIKNKLDFLIDCIVNQPDISNSVEFQKALIIALNRFDELNSDNVMNEIKPYYVGHDELYSILEGYQIKARNIAKIG